MPVPPEVQAEIDSLKTAIADEATEISTKVGEVIAAVQAGQDTTETVAQLRDLRTSINALSDKVVAPSTPVDPNAPTG